MYYTTLFFTVTLHTACSLSAFLTTLLSHSKKQNILALIFDYDAFVEQNFNSQLNYQKIHTQMKYCFIIFWILMFTCFISFCSSVAIMDPLYLFYTIQIHIPNHIACMQAFELFIFLRGIEARLELILSCNFNDRKVILKQSLYQIFVIWKEIYKSIGLAIFLNIMNVFAAFLMNSFWFFMMCIKSNNGSFLGEF